MRANWLYGRITGEHLVGVLSGQGTAKYGSSGEPSARRLGVRGNSDCQGVCSRLWSRRNDFDSFVNKLTSFKFGVEDGNSLNGLRLEKLMHLR
jgi:hypothetical protein